MARKKPYSLKLLLIDLILLLITGGFWIVIMLLREYRAHNR